MSKWENVDLVKNLNDRPGVARLSEVETSFILEKLSEIIGCENTNKRWWWEDSKLLPFKFTYGEKVDFYSDLLTQANGLEKPAYILVTADYTPPWPCFKTNVETMVTAISNSSFAEFIIIGLDLKWAMVDNHHNQLLLYGHYKID